MPKVFAVPIRNDIQNIFVLISEEIDAKITTSQTRNERRRQETPI